MATEEKIKKEVKPKVKSKAEVEVELEVEVKPKPEVETKLKTETKVKTKPKAKPKAKTKSKEEDRYIEAVGRRKTATARVRVWTKGKGFVVNGMDMKEYFPTYDLQTIITSPIDMLNIEEKFKISVLVKGSGKIAQSVAVRHGLSRVLIKINPELRKRLKKAGYLKRDPRMRERKKFGLRRARKSTQWSKR